MKELYLAIIEDDMVIRDSLVMSISAAADMVVSFICSSVEDSLLILANESTKVDVLLLDIGLPGMSGLEGITHIKKIRPELDIVMLTTYDDTETIFQSLCNGACSYISKKTSLKNIMMAVRSVFEGGSYMSPSIARKLVNHLSVPHVKTLHDKLSERQLDIVKNLSEGLSYKLIADKMNISIDTVRFHIKNIYRELEVNSKSEVLKLYYNAKK